MKRRYGLLAALLAGLLIAASGPGTYAQGPSRGRMGFRSGGPSSLLRRDDVRKELELTDEQVKDLEKIAEQQREARGRMFQDMRNLSREEIMAKFRQSSEKIQAQIDDVLLPPQSRRLKQLTLQMGLRGGIGSVLFGDQVTEELNITESQKEELQAKGRQLEEELRTKVAQLRKQALEQLVKELNPQQQAKFKSLIGEPFEFKQEPRGQGGRSNMFGRPGGAGGRGSRRSGR